MVLLLTSLFLWPTPDRMEPDSSHQGIFYWQGVEFLGLTCRLPLKDIPNPWYSGVKLGESPLVRWGVGVSPPIGLGVWATISNTNYWPDDLVVSLRTTYTPLMLWKENEQGLTKRAQLGIFVESGLSLADWVKFKTGFSGSFSLTRYFLTISAEAGWMYSEIDYTDAYGPYLSFTTSILNHQYALTKPHFNETRLDNKQQHMWLAIDALTAAGGFKMATYERFFDEYGTRVRVSDYLHTVELSPLKFGVGLSDPINLGLWARIWTGSLSKNSLALSSRVSYTPFSLRTGLGKQSWRYLQVALFAEPGVDFCQPNGEFCFRAGASITYSSKPWLFPISIETGWFFHEWYFQNETGVYLLCSASILGREFNF